eukprot:TRINITY_DN1682_c0_g1_i1.p1 TRINITY_DN1682_c0_g1~~TRINITY_DN1682_c0_g1_i1.p1  ORF type:complete len:207 (+),score=44.32 TRINITY_DN1682_c0_g1_i1:135-755(+)
MSSSKKRTTADEKREKIKEIFIETKDVLTLKELQKIAPKQKGINAMVVEEVLKQLLDDNMVSTDKVGISNYYWSFPSQQLHTKRLRIDTLTQQIEAGKRKKDDLQKQIKSLNVGREVSEERQERLKQLTQLQKQNSELKTELQQYADCDPDFIKALEDGSKIAHEAANRWTDNIFSVRSYVCDKFSTPQEQFNNNFEISDSFDYIS